MLGVRDRRLDEGLGDLLVRSVEDDADPEALGHDGQEPVEEPHGGDRAEEDEPEVEEDVDLLVDDVNREDAERVVGLDGAGGPVLVEPALGHLGEHPVHGVLAGVQVHLALGEHVAAELGELVAEEEVGQVDLADHVDEVENLAEDELQEVGASP